MASVTWHENCKLRAVSNEYCLDFIGPSIDEISHFSSLRHCLRLSKWRVWRSVGRNSRPIATLRYQSEPPFDAESKLCTHLIVAQPPREPQPDFTSTVALPNLEEFTAPNFRLNKDNVADESPLANALNPVVFPLLLDVKTSVIWRITTDLIWTHAVSPKVIFQSSFHC